MKTKVKEIMRLFAPQFNLFKESINSDVENYNNLINSIFSDMEKTLRDKVKEVKDLPIKVNTVFTNIGNMLDFSFENYFTNDEDDNFDWKIDFDPPENKVSFNYGDDVDMSSVKENYKYINKIVDIISNKEVVNKIVDILNDGYKEVIKMNRDHQENTDSFYKSVNSAIKVFVNALNNTIEIGDDVSDIVSIEGAIVKSITNSNVIVGYKNETEVLSKRFKITLFNELLNEYISSKVHNTINS